MPPPFIETSFTTKAEYDLWIQDDGQAQKQLASTPRSSVESLPREVLTHALGQLAPEELVAVLSTSEGLRACGTAALKSMPAPKTYRVALVSGDDTGDGHGKSKDFNIMSNLDVKELECAYRDGVEVLGFDVANWSNFEADSTNKALPQEACKKFEKHGLDLSEWIEDEEDDDDSGIVRLDCYERDFPLLWLFTAKLGAPQVPTQRLSNRRLNPSSSTLILCSSPCMDSWSTSLRAPIASRSVDGVYSKAVIDCSWF